ncbi:uncharacterized protein LOC102808825 [Saccoglossus kowalevskii]|uniref:Uncharacterized protein LOC102808825 n=1 Tax=Saccoglossus kowalevskii TaxID=10224 RepID=A0ABM0M146_SACKO|nr:PREDICTED: uncharacterized protein LOC102808825 [Saccoglossus kowalevskii]
MNSDTYYFFLLRFKSQRGTESEDTQTIESSRSLHVEVLPSSLANSDRGKTEATVIRNVTLPAYQQIELEYYLRHASQIPVCVLFYDQDASVLQNILISILSSDGVKTKDGIEVRIGSYPITKKVRGIEIPKVIPSLRCYLATTTTTSSFFEYDGEVELEQIKAWFSKTMLERNNMIMEACDSNIDDNIMKSPTTLIAFPGKDKFQYIESMLLAIKAVYETQILLVQPQSAHEEKLAARFGVNKYPTMLIINRKDWLKGSVKVTKRVESLEVRREIVELYLTALSLPMERLSMSSLQSTIMKYPGHTSLSLVCFYASWGKDVAEYLRVFERTSQTFTEFGAAVSYGLLDIKEVPEVVPQYVNATLAKTVPFIIAFQWRKDSLSGETKLIQKILGHALPTPTTVYEHLMENGLALEDDSGNSIRYASWMSHPNHLPVSYGFTSSSPICTAYDNTTHLSKQQEDFYYPTQWRRDSSKMVKSGNASRGNKTTENKNSQTQTPKVFPELEKIGKIPVLTDTTWVPVIESTDISALSQPFSSSKPTLKLTDRAMVAMVIYIQADCGSCSKNMEVFQQIAKSVQFIDGCSVYLVNCTASPITCQEQKIVGFPTLIGYRKLNWLDNEKCISLSMTDHYIRLDYHGAITVKLVLEWFSQVTLSTMTKVSRKELQKQTMIENVRVVGTMYPLSIAGKYLPHIAGVGRWFPLQCFMLICERLYGKTVCYAEKTPDIAETYFTDDNDEDMVVSQVRMIRRDHVEVTLFNLGMPLMTTLEDETNNKIHEFHTPHRYDIRPGQRCEDDHAACTDMLVDFIEDHRRLPVTQITETSFHTSSNWKSGSAQELPILIALAHGDNITEKSPFLQDLTHVAYKYYNFLITTTLDVDEFPGWSAQFIPADYRRNIIENTSRINDTILPSLFVYPRLCVVRWSNHRKAAFYPPIEEFNLVDTTDEPKSISSDEMDTFVKRVLENEKTMMIKTEHF